MRKDKNWFPREGRGGMDTVGSCATIFFVISYFHIQKIQIWQKKYDKFGGNSKDIGPCRVHEA